ncbi:hypothetical protein ACHAWO_001599 [Cyclotella atomus]|uniref:Uncharacterized protein n=1 Tax=Cyclotella atomus TaxID=382360 RepID=A0ABD3P0F7_9STRA
MHDSFTSEEKQDRREIYRKLQKHCQESKQRGHDEDDNLSLLEETNNETSYRSFRQSSHSSPSEYEQDGSEYDQDDYTEEELVTEEDYEAMNQALSSPPVAWWQMRKQWQNKSNVAKLLGRFAASEEEEGHNNGVGLDSSYRPGTLTAATTMEGEVVSHPVMLADPQSMGYDAGAFWQNPFADEKDRRNKGKYRHMIMYVPRSVVHKRRVHQMSYIAGAICTIILVVFFLEQRKLSNYAMVDSPMSLSAYLAGEQMNPEERTSVENIQLLPVPKATRKKMHEKNLVMGGEALRSAADFTSSSVEMHVSHRYNSLRQLLVSQGITPEEEFDYPSTPQAQALHWMAYQDLHPGLDLGFGHDEYAAKKMIQRYALAVTYYATNGPGWHNQINFLSDKDECEWNAITKEEGYFIGAGDCDDHGFITALALWSNNLVGALPEELGTLSTITTFSLYDNNMRGPPPRILRKLHGLKILYLNKNQFIGNLDYMCDLGIETMKADCGEIGGVTCSCCTGCGWNMHQERPLRLEHGKNP